MKKRSNYLWFLYYMKKYGVISKTVYIKSLNKYEKNRI